MHGCYFFFALLWWSIPVWYPWITITCESQPNFHWLDLSYGGQNIWMWGVRGQEVWDSGGKSMGCVMLSAPIAPIVQVWSAILTHIHWVARSFYPFSRIYILMPILFGFWYRPLIFILFCIVYTIYNLSILSGLVLSHQLSAPSNYELEPSGL